MRRRDEESETIEKRIQDIFNVVMERGNLHQKRLLVQMIFHLHPEKDKPPIDFSVRSRHVMTGSKNQYYKGASSACTSIAQRFISRVLAAGTAWRFSEEDIDRAIDEGIQNHDLLLHNAQMTVKRIKKENDDPDLMLRAAFSNVDSLAIYDLNGLKADEGGFLRADKDGSTEPFFEHELTKLEGLLTADRHSVGGIIHSQEKTFAIAVIRKATHMEYVLFDSHGSLALNGHYRAFAIVTNNRKELARDLSIFCPFKPTKPVGGDFPISAAQAKQIEKADNPYILYPVVSQENAIFPGAPRSIEAPREDKAKEPTEHAAEDSEVTFDGNDPVHERKVRILTYLIFLSVMGTMYQNRKMIHHYLFPVHSIPVVPKPPLVVK
jgi:hypothetical protein